MMEFMDCVSFSSEHHAELISPSYVGIDAGIPPNKPGGQVINMT